MEMEASQITLFIGLILGFLLGLFASNKSFRDSVIKFVKSKSGGSKTTSIKLADKVWCENCQRYQFHYQYKSKYFCVTCKKEII